MFGDWSHWCGSPENVAGCLVTDHNGVAVLLRLHLMVDNGSSNNLALNTPLNLPWADMLIDQIVLSFKFKEAQKEALLDKIITVI